MSNVDYLLDNVSTTITGVTNINFVGGSKVVVKDATTTYTILILNLIEIY